jgi:WD40 repeat protein
MMTPMTSSCTRSLFLRGLSRVLAIVVLGIAAHSAGCIGAPQGDGSPNNQLNAEASSWRLPFSYQELQVLATHISPTLSAEFTADGKWMVVAGTDGVTIHDVVSTNAVHWFNGYLVEVSPDGASLLLKHPNGAPELRSIPDGSLLWRLPTDIAASPMHFSDDGRYLVCGDRDLLRIDTQQVVYRAPKSYHFDTYRGGDQYRDPADRPPQDDQDDERAAKLRVLPHIYRTTLRDDGRPLITLKSGSCSPAGQFMIVQTGEEDTSYIPYYSFIHRKTGERLFTDVSSRDALFFHNDDYVLYREKVYRTADGEVLYTLESGVTASSLNPDETLLAVGWRNGQVAVLDPLSGEDCFRVTVEKHIDAQWQKSGDVVSLAFSADSAALAAVGRKLTLIDIPSRAVSSVLDLGPGSREVGKPTTTSPAEITFNADASRLLLTGVQGDEYIYARPKAFVFQSADIRRYRALGSPDYFDRLQTIPPVYFNSDAAWALLPQDGRGRLASVLQLWSTEAEQPLVEIRPQVFQRYRQDYVVPDSPKRHLGLGRFRGWRPGELVLYPWSIDSIQAGSPVDLPDAARQWLQTFVHASHSHTVRHTNGLTLDFPERQWVLSFSNNRVSRLWDLSTGETYPSDSAELTAERVGELDATDIPETCWGLAGIVGNAFSPDGSRLLLSSRRYRGKQDHLLALFEMPSGRLIRHYEGHAHISRIHFAPNQQIAAISTDFYNKTWIIDLETGETLVELPKGGKCVFSPDSRYAQIGDRYGDSRSLLTIETGDLLDFRWAKRWAFSPNSRYAMGGTGRSWFFLDLASGERTEITGEIHQTFGQPRLTTQLDLPYQGNRFLCVEKGVTKLFDVNTAEVLAEFDPIAIADDRASRVEKAPHDYVPSSAFRYSYTPDDQSFVQICAGSSIAQKSPGDEGQGGSRGEASEYSTQVLIGDLETGSQIQCSAPVWSRRPLQHNFFSPDGSHLITISADKMVRWKLHPLEIVWETRLSDRWTDPETGELFAQEETLRWSLDFMMHPDDQSILIAADGREAILFCLATGEEKQRFGPLPINSVLRFGSDGAYLQVSFRAHRSMRLYDTSTGKLTKTFHFTERATQLHRFDAVDAQEL